MSELDYPYRIDARGRTAATTRDDHVRDLIEQVLFTAPGERVMRPDFGSGLLALTFEPNSPELATTSQYLVHGSLQQHLAHLIAVESVVVEQLDAALVIQVTYMLLADQTRHTAEVHAPVGPSSP